MRQASVEIDSLSMRLRGIDQSKTLEQSVEFWIAPHEFPIELCGVFAVALGKNRFAKARRSFGIEYALVFEASERVRIQHLGPFITVITGSVADWIRKQMSERGEH